MNLPVKNLVNIFPCSKDIGIRNSKLFYEQNITNMVRHITDNPSFVISGDIDTNGVVTEDGNLKLNLYGYFIELRSGTSLATFTDGEELYIGVKLTNEANLPHELDGQIQDSENESIYTAIELSSSIGEDKNVHYLHLLTKDGEHWRIPVESRSKFNIESLYQPIDEKTTLIMDDIDGIHPIQ